MDFLFKKPTHLFALLLLICSIVVIVVLPIFSYFEPSTSSTPATHFSGIFEIIFEVLLVGFSLLFVFFLMIVVPMLWYYLVNHQGFRGMMQRMNLRREGIRKAFFWGIITAGIGIFLTIGIDLILVQLGFDLSNASNIPMLEEILSPPAIVVIVTIQPIAEEVFFRGYLLDKIQTIAGIPLAVISTAVLFGLAHLTYGMIYTTVMAMIIGALFAILVIKTKNLYASITAHILMNVISITFYFFGKSLGI